MSHVFLVCIDSPNAGRFSSPHMSREVAFRSLSDFILMADSHCNRRAAPQSSVRLRSFGDGCDTVYDDLESDTALPLDATPHCTKGSVATFLVTVLRRQNATWQGSVHWMEGKKQETFRSAFELIRIIYSAL
jgi:hypothetical protein